MPGVRTTLLLALIAVGVACIGLLVWGFARDAGDQEAEPAEVTPREVAAPPSSEYLTSGPGNALTDLLDTWSRSGEQRARWLDAVYRSGGGLSLFERRLWVGEILGYLRADLEAGRVAPARVHRHLQILFDAGVLDLEVWRSGMPSVIRGPYGGEVTLRLALEELTKPIRARHALTLHGHEGDALATGRDLRLRVWTPRGVSVVPQRVEETLALLERLDSIAGVDARASVDVLATPARGEDVFPTLGLLPSRVIGVYLRKDQLAVVGTQHTPEAFRRLIQHEVIHAWHRAARPRWRRPFATEGLATYGSHLRPADEGLSVPAVRLRDDLAWLVQVVTELEDLGLELTDAHLRVLVRVRPRTFYRLGWFAYALAEACYAYVGSSAIEEALRSDSDEVLLAQFEAIAWSDLLAWANEHAAGGRADAAWFVTDSPLLGGEESPEQPSALAMLGLDVPAERSEQVVTLLWSRRRSSRSTRMAPPPMPSRTGPTKEPEYEGRHYIGVRGCKKCHFKTSRSWKGSPHAKAYDLLAPGEAVEAKRKAGLDPQREFRSGHACLRCHTTGYGTTSGYPVPRAGEQLTDELRWRLRQFAGVGCEACHGMGSEYGVYKKDHERYLRPDITALGANVPIRGEHCTGCHKSGCPTMPEDYTFDFEASLGRESFHELVPLKHDHGPAD